MGPEDKCMVVYLDCYYGPFNTYKEAADWLEFHEKEEYDEDSKIVALRFPYLPEKKKTDKLADALQRPTDTCGDSQAHGFACDSDPGTGQVYTCNSLYCPVHGDRNQIMTDRGGY